MSNEMANDSMFITLNMLSRKNSSSLVVVVVDFFVCLCVVSLCHVSNKLRHDVNKALQLICLLGL